MQLSGKRMDYGWCRMHSGRRAGRAALTQGEMQAGEARRRVRTTHGTANRRIGRIGRMINYQQLGCKSKVVMSYLGKVQMS